MDLIRALLAAMGGLSPFAKFFAVWATGIAVIGVKYANAHFLATYGLALPIPDAHFTDWLTTAATSVFTYYVPNSPAPPAPAAPA